MFAITYKSAYEVEPAYAYIPERINTLAGAAYYVILGTCYDGLDHLQSTVKDLSSLRNNLLQETDIAWGSDVAALEDLTQACECIDMSGSEFIPISIHEIDGRESISDSNAVWTNKNAFSERSGMN